jgi:hypothetical protein
MLSVDRVTVNLAKTYHEHSQRPLVSGGASPYRLGAVTHGAGQERRATESAESSLALPFGYLVPPWGP